MVEWYDDASLTVHYCSVVGRSDRVGSDVADKHHEKREKIEKRTNRKMNKNKNREESYE